MLSNIQLVYSVDKSMTGHPMQKVLFGVVSFDTCNKRFKKWCTKCRKQWFRINKMFEKQTHINAPFTCFHLLLNLTSPLFKRNNQHMHWPRQCLILITPKIGICWGFVDVSKRFDILCVVISIKNHLRLLFHPYPYPLSYIFLHRTHSMRW